MSNPICEIFPNDPDCFAEPTSICDIFPNDPDCVAENPEPITDPIETGEAEEGAEKKDAEPKMKGDNSAAASKAVADWNAVKDMSNMAMMDSPLMANLAYFGVAA